MSPHPGWIPTRVCVSANRGSIGRDEEVAVERKLEAAGDGDAVDRSDDGFADLGNRAAAIGGRVGHALAAALAAAELLQIESRAERGIGAGEDDDAHVVAIVALAHDARQQSQHFA